MTLRVGIAAQPATPAAVELVRQAERLGVDSVWAPELQGGRCARAAVRAGAGPEDTDVLAALDAP